MSNLRVSLFGRFQVEAEGKSLAASLDARKVQELFSYVLIYRDRPHSRETLAEILWGENSNAQSRKYLRQALWQLQTALKQDDGSDTSGVLVVDADWVGVNCHADAWIDVNEFEKTYAAVQGKPGSEVTPEQAAALVQAVELHQGGLLDGWYSDWCIFERERLQSMWLAMLNKLMVFFESRKEYETGISYGQRILQCDRAHERTHRSLMRLHYLAGDRTAALRQYERCVATLDEELGVEPAKRTRALYDQIRADYLDDPKPAAAEPEPPAATSRMNDLEALLSEFQRQIQQYKHLVGIASTSQD